MENNETSNSINEDQNESSRKFLKITNVKIFSNAYNLRLKEDDIIIGFNGEYFNSSYEDLKKVLNADEEEKILTIFRQGVYFNITTKNINGVTTNYLLISKNVVLDYEVTPSYEIQLNVKDTIENIQSRTI